MCIRDRPEFPRLRAADGNAEPQHLRLEHDLRNTVEEHQLTDRIDRTHQQWFEPYSRNV